MLILFLSQLTESHRVFPIVSVCHSPSRPDFGLVCSVRATVLHITLDPHGVSTCFLNVTDVDVIGCANTP